MINKKRLEELYLTQLFRQKKPHNTTRYEPCHFVTQSLTELLHLVRDMISSTMLIFIIQVRNFDLSTDGSSLWQC
jgi:hypothetical protein